jgi:hypothetical protein
MSGETNGLLVPDEIVMNKIYHIRGLKVMVDKDLAELYEVQTRNLNTAVGRNLKRFPDEDFMFQLTDEEFKNLMFQNGTSSWGGTRKDNARIPIATKSGDEPESIHLVSFQAVQPKRERCA